MKPVDPDVESDATPRSTDVIVVPTYNEADTIARLLALIGSAAPHADVLVVDDSSPDGTAGIVRADCRFGSKVFLLQRAVKNGLGGAYRAGFGWALDRGYQRVVQMDADLSHPPERIPTLLAALGGADVAVGSRYVIGGATPDWAAGRKLLSRGGNAYVRVVLGLRTRDCTAGFKAFRSEVLRRIDACSSTSDGYCFQVENTWRAERAGMTVTEIPITFTDRTAGESKMSTAIVCEALTRVLAWRARELMRRSGQPAGSAQPGRTRVRGSHAARRRTDGSRR